MDLNAYEAEAANEETNWWYVGRRQLFNSVISGLGIPNKTRVLDIGTSCGGNLRLLRKCGLTEAFGMDCSSDALRFCISNGFNKVFLGDVTNMPFSEGEFGLVLATDILEHIDDEGNALAQIRRIMAPGAHIIITVPSFQSLWGHGDIIAKHKRRYRLNRLYQLLRDEHLECSEIFYFNYLLFVPVFFARRIIRATNRRLIPEANYNAPLLNYFLKFLFAIDVKTARRLKPPFGVSIMAVAKKP
tara:strand:- start:6821 stop:7552 length:732 start_codon:yes stop_codon:yes gene_type:complete